MEEKNFNASFIRETRYFEIMTNTFCESCGSIFKSDEEITDHNGAGLEFYACHSTPLV